MTTYKIETKYIDDAKWLTYYPFKGRTLAEAITAAGTIAQQNIAYTSKVWQVRVVETKETEVTKIEVVDSVMLVMDMSGRGISNV